MSPLFVRLITIAYLVGAAALEGQSFAASYNAQTVAGGDYAGDNGLASAALLQQLEGVAMDGRGNLYIADAADHRVRRIAPSGIISTVAGTGHAGFSGDGGPAASAQLRTPYGLAADRIGNLYIADLGNSRIRRVTAEGTITTIAGGGTATSGDGRAATDVALSMPRNIGIDYYGTIYFSDFGAHRVYQISPAGTLNLVAGNGEAGLAGDGGAATRAQLSAPAGVAVDAAGTVYIADTGNGRVRTVYRGVIATLGDGGVAGAKPSIAITTPLGVAVDPDGSLFIADVGGNQVLRVTPALGTTPIALPARDIYIDSQGNLYACSGSILLRRARLGTTVVLTGDSGTAYLGDGGPLAKVRLAQPGGVARDVIGNVYIADTGHHRIRKISIDGSISTVAGNGIRGFGGDGGSAMAAQLDTPVGVALDVYGWLYIGDSGNHRVRRVDRDGKITTVAGTGTRGRSPDGVTAIKAQLNTPTWVVPDGTGGVYFSETGGHAVRRVTASGTLGTLAGTGEPGFTGDGGAGFSANLDSPQGLGVDVSGGVYIADTGNRRIRYVSPPSGYGPALIATVPDNAAATWKSPRGLAIDRLGSLYITDAADARVFRMDPPGRVLTIAGTGATGFNGEMGAALSQLLDTPSGLTVDAAGNVILVDSGNGRLRSLTPLVEAAAAPAPSTQSSNITVVNAASLQPGIAPGELVTIFGSGLGPAAGLSATQSTVELGGVQVLFNGHLAPLFYADRNQINLQAPYSLGEGVTCEVQVVAGGVVKARATVSIAASAPAIFTTQSGSGQAAALNEDGSLNSMENPVTRGSVIVLFATGEGSLTPAAIEGRPAGVPSPKPVLPVSVRIGDYMADMLYAGAAPGFTGLLQVNARVPSGFLPPGTLPVLLQVGGASSQAGVTIAVR